MEVCFSVSWLLSFKSPQGIKECEVYTGSKSMDFLGLALAIEWLFLMYSPGHSWIFPLCPPGCTAVRNSNSRFLSELLPGFPEMQPEARTAEGLLPATIAHRGRPGDRGRCCLWTMPPAMQTSQCAHPILMVKSKLLFTEKPSSHWQTENLETFKEALMVPRAFPFSIFYSFQFESQDQVSLKK